MGAWYEFSKPPHTNNPLTRLYESRDTVSSVGLFRSGLLPLTDTCKHIKRFRHALALDERRVKFLPEYALLHDADARDENHVKEVWFAGTHSDMFVGVNFSNIFNY